MIVWQKEEKIDKALKIFLFLVSPFVAALYALRNIKTKSSFVVFFLFAVFFGMSFTVPTGKTDDFRFDGASYRAKFDRYIYYFSDLDYLTSLKNYVIFNEGSKDIYFFTITHFVSDFTSNYHVLFMVAAMIFAFFALKSLKILVLEDCFQNTVGGLILLYIFMYNDIFNINGLRFWTAAWIGVYCIFKIFKDNDRKYFLLAILTPLIHGSFWVFLIVILGAYFSKKTFKPWVALFLISFFVSNFSVQLVQGIVDTLPPFLANMAEAYASEEYIEERANKGSGFIWVTEVFSFFVRVYMNLMVWLFIKNAKKISSNPKTKKLFSFLLIWMTFVNFSMPIPSLGSRFMALSFPIIAYIWLVNFYGVKYKRVLYAMPFVFVMAFYKNILVYNQVLDSTFFISSPFYLIYEYLLSA